MLWHPRKPAFSKQSYSQNSDETKDAEYNRRAAIIEGFRARRSAMEIIRFFGCPRSIVYDVVTKYMALGQSNEDSNMPAYEESLERTHREDPRSR